jgi:hypothetical protein
VARGLESHRTGRVGRAVVGKDDVG